MPRPRVRLWPMTAMSWRTLLSRPFLVLPIVVVLVAVVVLTLYWHPWSPCQREPCVGASCTVVRGLVGSEKSHFFADPAVQKAFAENGLRLEVTAVGSRQMASGVANALHKIPYDFVFPGGDATLFSVPGIKHSYPAFASPLAVASSRPVVDALLRGGEGLVTDEGQSRFMLDMRQYLTVVATGRRWDNMAVIPELRTRMNVLVRTADPRDANSAALFAALAASVANGQRAVTAEDATSTSTYRAVAPIFLRQGALDSRTEKTFADYLEGSASYQTRLALVYEAQYLALTASERARLVQPELLYLKPTVLSVHTLGALTDKGEKVGELLQTTRFHDLAAANGFRDLQGYGGNLPSLPALPEPVPVPLQLEVLTPPDHDVLDKLTSAVTR
jgi:hypothetical protein